MIEDVNIKILPPVRRKTSTNRRIVFWAATALLFFIFLFLIRSILLPFVLGVFIAYFLDPAADKLEKAGLSRSMATASITATFFTGVILLIVLILPTLTSQLSDLFVAIPGYIARMEQQLRPLITHWLGEIPAEDIESLKAASGDISTTLMGFLGGFLSGLFQSGVAFFNVLSLILITPVVGYYLLQDWDKIVARIDSLLPRAHANTIREQWEKIDQTLAGFIRGQSNVCLLLSAFYVVLLTIAGLKFSIVIGIMTGILIIVPYVGWLLGFLTGMGVAFFQFENMEDISIILAIFLAGQVLESYFLTPKLVGNKVGLHPVWIIFGMLAGAALFGFVGILLAVPLSAVIGVLLRFAIERYLQSSYYKGEAVRTEL